MINRAMQYLFSDSSEPVDTASRQQLLMAARDGDLPGMSRVLNYIRDVDVRDENNNTPLILAAARNKVNAVRVLLNHGADIDAVGEKGYTALAAAVQMGQVDAVNFLLSAHANIEAKTNIRNPPTLTGLTPLWIAVSKQNEAMVRLLIHHGADVHAVDGANNPLLAFAVYCGNAQIVGMLLQAGAERNCRCADGKTAEMHARERQRMDLVTLLYADPDDIAEVNYLQLAPHMVQAPLDDQMDEFEQDFASEAEETAPPAVSVSAALDDAMQDEEEFPERYICPISQEVMADPVTTPYGHTFDREYLRQHFLAQERQGMLENGSVPCPITRQPLPATVLDFGTNITIRDEIAAIREQRKVAKEARAPEPEDVVRKQRLRYFGQQGMFARKQPEALHSNNMSLPRAPAPIL